MARYILLLESNCKDPAREAEFNEWYNKIHVPDVMMNPNYVKASRWMDISSAEGKGKYIALYEIETDDIDKTIKAQQEYVASLRAKGRVSELIVTVSRRYFKQISSLSK